MQVTRAKYRLHYFCECACTLIGIWNKINTYVTIEEWDTFTEASCKFHATLNHAGLVCVGITGQQLYFIPKNTFSLLNGELPGTFCCVSLFGTEVYTLNLAIPNMLGTDINNRKIFCAVKIHLCGRKYHNYKTDVTSNLCVVWLTDIDITVLTWLKILCTFSDGPHFWFCTPVHIPMLPSLVMKQSRSFFTANCCGQVVKDKHGPILGKVIVGHEHVVEDRDAFRNKG
jgi:hypothetical protein